MSGYSTAPNLEYGGLPDNVWRKIDARGPCWEWTGTKSHGYGMVRVAGHRSRVAHRVVYESLCGTVPDGFDLDHLCRNRGCVNPDHLEPVAPRENVLRGVSGPAINARRTHCDAGHPLDGANLYTYPNGNHRECRTCRLRRQRAWHADRKAKRAS